MLVQQSLSRAVHTTVACLQTYSPWQPFQFLVYWFELCQHYQGVYGQFYALDPAHYHKFSGSAACCARI